MKILNKNPKFGEAGPFEAESFVALAAEMLPNIRAWAKEELDRFDDGEDKPDLSIVVERLLMEFVDGLEEVKVEDVEYTTDRSSNPPTCFPDNLDTTGFIDVTNVGDTWRKFLDPKTGDIHDCSMYYVHATSSGRPRSSNSSQTGQRTTVTLTYDDIVKAWNAQADSGNQWYDLGSDEMVEFTIQYTAAICAQVCDDLATKVAPGALASDLLREASAEISLLSKA